MRIDRIQRIQAQIVVATSFLARAKQRFGHRHIVLAFPQNGQRRLAHRTIGIRDRVGKHVRNRFGCAKARDDVRIHGIGVLAVSSHGQLAIRALQILAQGCRIVQGHTRVTVRHANHLQTTIRTSQVGLDRATTNNHVARNNGARNSALVHIGNCLRHGIRDIDIQIHGGGFRTRNRGRKDRESVDQVSSPVILVVTSRVVGVRDRTILVANQIEFTKRRNKFLRVGGRQGRQINRSQGLASERQRCKYFACRHRHIELAETIIQVFRNGIVTRLQTVDVGYHHHRKLLGFTLDSDRQGRCLGVAIGVTDGVGKHLGFRASVIPGMHGIIGNDIVVITVLVDGQRAIGTCQGNACIHRCSPLAVRHHRHVAICACLVSHGRIAYGGIGLVGREHVAIGTLVVFQNGCRVVIGYRAVVFHIHQQLHVVAGRCHRTILDGHAKAQTQHVLDRGVLVVQRTTQGHGVHGLEAIGHGRIYRRGSHHHLDYFHTVDRTDDGVGSIRVPQDRHAIGSYRRCRLGQVEGEIASNTIRIGELDQTGSHHGIGSIYRARVV